MAELRFEIEGAAPVPHAASPQLALHARVHSSAAMESVLLRTSVRIEAGARTTTPQEQARLKELFGDQELWGRSSRSLLWAQVVNVVSAFTGQTEVELWLPCSFDLAAVASKYLRALDGGTVPIRAQFSGTAFFRTEHGLSAAPIALDREAAFALPVQTFLAALDQHFPNAAAVTLRRDVFNRLDQLRVARGLGTFDDVIESLLDPRISRTKRGVA